MVLGGDQLAPRHAAQPRRRPRARHVRQGRRAAAREEAASPSTAATSARSARSRTSTRPSSRCCSAQGYVPVISPIGARRRRPELQHQRRRGGGGDRDRAEGARSSIYLTDVAGITRARRARHRPARRRPRAQARERRNGGMRVKLQRDDRRRCAAASARARHRRPHAAQRDRRAVHRPRRRHVGDRMSATTAQIAARRSRSLIAMRQSRRKRSCASCSPSAATTSRRRRCRATSRSSVHAEPRSPAAARTTSCAIRRARPTAARRSRARRSPTTARSSSSTRRRAPRRSSPACSISARVPEVLGTIAGDDAIFIAPARRRRRQSSSVNCERSSPVSHRRSVRLSRTAISEHPWHTPCSISSQAPMASYRGVSMSGVLSNRLENSVDATRGQPLAARVLARKNELEDALAELGPHDARRASSDRDRARDGVPADDGRPGASVGCRRARPQSLARTQQASRPRNHPPSASAATRAAPVAGPRTMTTGRRRQNSTSKIDANGRSARRARRHGV